MSKSSLRQSLLERSVQRLLDEGEDVHEVVIMLTRHRWFLPYSILCGVAVGLIASISGFDGSFSWLAIGVASGAIAGMATTNYWAFAETNHGRVLCQSSRVRQYAKKLIKRLPADTPVKMVGSTVVSSDWEIEGVIYTMTKRWEATMRQLAGSQMGD